MFALALTEPENCSHFTRLLARKERVSCPTRARHDTRRREYRDKECLKAIRDRLEKATAVAKAADACAEAGNPDKAVTIAQDVEQLVYEVNTFLNAASLMNRCYGP
jgi:hypothetical protein